MNNGADELFIYQLFQNILNTSYVMEGRFHVLRDKRMSDIQETNFGETLTDFLGGLQEKKKYPCVVMLPPTEEQILDDKGWTNMVFNMLFLCLDRRTGDGDIKTPNVQTNTSMHTFQQDWKDMRECAGNFKKMLRTVTRDPTITNLIHENRRTHDEYSRVTYKANDKLNGVLLTFQMQVWNNYCEMDDYPGGPGAITIPDINSHIIHKQ